MEVECVDLSYPLINHPTTLQLIGPSFSGKTTILKRLLKYRQDIFSEDFNHIIYCYGESTSNFEKDIPEAQLHKGLPTQEELEGWIALYSHSPWIICIDDLGQEFHNSQIGSDICTKLSHHFNVSVILISHSLYQAGTKAGSSRLISLNMHNFIFTRSLRDLGVYANFGRQCLGNGCGSAFVQSFLDATEPRDDIEKPGYLLATLHPLYSTRGLLLFTNIFRDEKPLVGYKT